MEEVVNRIFNLVGISKTEHSDLDGILIERELLLNNESYEKIKPLLPLLKKYFSSSFLTSLQQNAEEKQKFPLINIIRQILKVHRYHLKPIRKANGYEKSGKKKYKRFFMIEKYQLNSKNVS